MKNLIPDSTNYPVPISLLNITYQAAEAASPE
jgi:hypothetical protein